jgi:uncharacterized transporter YbjL
VIVLAGSAVGAAVIDFAGLPASLTAGLLTGALTSTPGLAAAKEAAAAIAASGAAGQAAEAVDAAVKAAEAAVAPVTGSPTLRVVGVVLFEQLVPKC